MNNKVTRSNKGKRGLSETQQSGAKCPDSQSGAEKHAADTDPVWMKYGKPFQCTGNGKVHLNERAIAAKCAGEHMIRYETGANSYSRYDQAAGAWLTISDVEVRRLIGDFLIKLGDEWKQQEIVRRVKSAGLVSLAKMLQMYQVDIMPEEPTDLFLATNGVVDLRGDKPKLLTHEPKYSFTVPGRIKFDAQALCPRFTKELLGGALAKEDISLAQRYFGSILLGSNTCHGILIIRGIGGSGKSTLVTIVERIIGESLVAQLRTEHLSGRFEQSAFIGKRLLVGKDVPGETLKETGARFLKSLVGGDLLQAEIKYNPNKQSIRGDYHVVVASNNNLQIAVDGDREAWARRLLIVDFNKKESTRTISDFAEVLFNEEASGILNWLIEGALAYRKEIADNGHLKLTEAQQKRIGTMLEDSDNVTAFVSQCVCDVDGKDVSNDELLIGYHKHCRTNNWTPLPNRAFQKRLPDLLSAKFFVCCRHDIQRQGSAVRGYKGITLN